MHIINLIRVKDWLKNILIFFPLIFSGLLFDQSYYTTLIIGFITFSILASCIYVINDIIDIKKDKLHPTKKISKPLAAQKISLKSSIFILILFFILAGFLTYYQPLIFFSIISYLIVSLSYNFYFKKIAYVEIIIISIGYIIRIDAGSKLINVESSILMLFSTFFLASYFLILKRVGELNHFESNKNYQTRNVLNFYNKSKLKKINLSLIFCLIITLLIYTFTKNINLIFSIIFTLFFLIKYYQLSKDSTMSENPINLILRNKLLLFLSLLIFLTSLIIYI